MIDCKEINWWILISPITEIASGCLFAADQYLLAMFVTWMGGILFGWKVIA